MTVLNYVLITVPMTVLQQFNLFPNQQNFNYWNWVVTILMTFMGLLNFEMIKHRRLELSVIYNGVIIPTTSALIQT